MMYLNENIYVPALRWRQAEYQALLRLKSSVKDQIVPLISIPDVEYDFEQQRPKKTVHEHVSPFLKRYRDKWGQRPAWITFHDAIADGRMDDGTHIIDYVFDGLRKYGANGTPAVPLTSAPSTVAAARSAAVEDGSGSGIVVRIEDLMAPNPRADVVSLARDLGVVLDDTDLIIDLKAPNFEPYGAFATALISAIRRLRDLHDFRNFVLVGTAIPESFSQVSRGTDEIPRHDWLFYRELLLRLPTDMRRPVYGDYTIVHPKFEAKDMRQIKPAGKIIYANDSAWITRKGGSFRDNRMQMYSHCEEVTQDGKFCFRGDHFSSGDAYISQCAARREGPSSLGRWKEVAINHHISLVVEDLASLSAASLF